jgi:preprotein translocase subunit SecA
MNKQREVVYGLRRDALLSDTPGELLFEIIKGEVEERVDAAFSVRVQDGDEMSVFDEIVSWLNSTMPLGFTRDDLLPEKSDVDTKTLTPLDMTEKDIDAVIDRIMERINKAYAAKIALEEPEALNWLERHTILEAIDRLWQDHLYAMDSLRSSITLRAYAQKDPLVEYKQEAFQLFSELMGEISNEVMSNVFRSASSLASFENLLASLPQQLIHDQMEQFDGAGGEYVEDDEQIQITFVRDTPKVGRNEPCPCGSGKKYKKCCGA